MPQISVDFLFVGYLYYFVSVCNGYHLPPWLTHRHTHTEKTDFDRLYTISTAS